MTNYNAAILQNITKTYRLYPCAKARLKESFHPFRKKYHKVFYALKNINLKVKKGEILGIVGRNGAGKSTLLKIIAGVLKPSSGNVQIQGMVSALLELGSGFNPEFTGIENIYFYGAVQGFSREEMKEKIEEIIDFAEIGEFIEQPLKIYSSGMKARLAFAVSIHIDPEILILDEVLSAGDELFRRKCYSKMEKYFKGGKTILYVSHNANNINELCSRAILLNQGKVILDGAAKMVTAYYQKMLYAEKESRESILKEIEELNKDEEKKKSFKIKKMKNEKNNQHQSFENDNVKVTELDKTSLDIQSYYVPDFKPKSTIKYKNHPVEFHDVCIKNLKGERVNHLVTGKRYIYEYQVKFGINACEVGFGMQIKTEKGKNIGSAGSYRMGKKIKIALKGEVYIVRWNFLCNLLSGIYYLNAGVSGIVSNQERVFLNRLIDSYVFKVIKSKKKGFGGIVSFNQDISIEKL